MDLNAIAQGLADHPTAWMLALAVGAIGYLYRELNQTKKEQIESIRAQEQAHRETLMKIVPVSEKLVESVEVLERITETFMKG